MLKQSAVFLVVVLLMLVSATGVFAAPADTDSNDVFWWWGDPAGSSSIVRTDSGISGNVNTSLSNQVGSAKGLAVTLWLVVFNNPEACGEDGCNDLDLGNPAVMPDVLYGAGNVVGGSENFSAGYHRQAGDNSGSIAALFGLPMDPNGEPFGLIDPRGAEIHYVVRLHGPKVAAEMPAQIQTYGGGCVFNAPVGRDFPTGPTDLYLGVGDCQDVQFAINLPQ